MFSGKLSTKDWELLSSYLDDELNPREKARVEARLNAQPEFKEALDGLRRTKTILHKAASRKVPHNFIVTRADVERVTAPRWLPTMQWSSAAVALVAVFLFAYQLVPGLTAVSKAADQRNALTSAGAPEAAQPMAASGAASSTPEVIYWGGPPSPAYGMGGGGGGASPCGVPGAQCGGGPAAIGGGAEGPVSSSENNPFPQPPIPNSRPDLQVQSTATPPAALKAEPVTGTGPILGIRPKDLQGSTLADSAAAIAEESQPLRSQSQMNRTWVWYAAGGLLAVAAGLLVVSIIVKRKTLG